MFTENDPYKRYRQTQIGTAGPVELVIMLYDGAIKFINQAKKCIFQKNFLEANRNLQRTQAIISELNINLNMEAGEVAENLRKLYEFINYKLVEANIKKDSALLDQVLEMIVDLRSSWVEINHPQQQAVAGK